MRNLPCVLVSLLFALWLAIGLQRPARAQDDNTELLGNLAGLRTQLSKLGGTLAIQDQENLLANLAGGVKIGATLQGVTTASLQFDTAAALQIPNGLITVSALQFHGQIFSPYYLDDIQEANGDEAENATMLLELSYDQAFPKKGIDIKIGQQSIDSDFVICQDAGTFINTMATWPTIISDDTYAGGPAAPFAALGLRLKLQLTAGATFLAGIYNDNPMDSPNDDDPVDRDDDGLRFNLSTGAFFITEFQQQITVRQNLPGTYEIGFWHDTASFPDQRLGTDNLSLADPESNGMPKQWHGNNAVYVVADQTVWQPSSARSLDVFAILMGAPGPENPIVFSFNGGVTLHKPLPGRDDDTAGLDVGVAKVSARAGGLDRDQGYYSGFDMPIRSAEGLIELTYAAQATSWLALQPDLQYVVNPGAGLLNPQNPTRKLRNELVVGIRITATF